MLATSAQAEVKEFLLIEWGGIQQANPNLQTPELNYQLCSGTPDDERQALFRMNIIGPGLVPAGSTISSASLRLRAQVGGDGLLYRCAEPWGGGTPVTWTNLGDVMTIGPSIGVGMNTGQGKSFDVKAHVQAWADGTPNYGWVIKGFVDDCQQARIYNGSASDGNRPELTVVYTPPDTAGPRIIAVDVGTTVTTHANVPVPGGSGAQIKSLPVARVNEFWVRFNEPVNIDRGDFSLVDAIDGTEHPLLDGMFGFAYPQGDEYRVFPTRAFHRYSETGRSQDQWLNQRRRNRHCGEPA